MTCILAIVTDAYGGYGGIAQYNRDLVSALAECGAAQSIDVLPRYAPDEVGRLPEKVRQHRPVRARGALSLAAIGLARRLTLNTTLRPVRPSLRRVSAPSAGVNA